MGWHILFRTLVAIGDHPKRVSYHLCSASFLTLSMTWCISFTLWWTVTSAFCLFFLIFSNISMKSWWSKDCFTKVMFIPMGVGKCPGLGQIWEKTSKRWTLQKTNPHGPSPQPGREGFLGNKWKEPVSVTGKAPPSTQKEQYQMTPLFHRSEKVDSFRKSLLGVLALLSVCPVLG